MTRRSAFSFTGECFRCQVSAPSGSGTTGKDVKTACSRTSCNPTTGPTSPTRNLPLDSPASFTTRNAGSSFSRSPEYGGSSKVYSHTLFTSFGRFSRPSLSISHGDVSVALSFGGCPRSSFECSSVCLMRFKSVLGVFYLCRLHHNLTILNKHQGVRVIAHDICSPGI